MEQGRMMDAGVNPVVVDYDANFLSLFLSLFLLLWRVEAMFLLEAISLKFYGEKVERVG